MFGQNGKGIELGNWEIGKLGNWEIGKLGNWEIGKLGNWEIGKLGNLFYKILLINTLYKIYYFNFLNFLIFLVKTKAPHTNRARRFYF